MKKGMLVVISAITSAVAVVGCGRSPTARTPVTLVRVPADQVQVVEACPTDDDDDDDDSTAPARRSVQYVPIDAWEPSPSVQQLEAKIQRRGAAPADYSSMPALTLHKPIAPTTFHGRRGYYYR